MMILPVLTDGASGVTAAPEGPDALADLLQQLADRCRSLGAPVDRLNPGITPGEIDHALASVGLRCPKEVRVLFGWHNGGNGGSWNAIPRFPYLPLESAIRRYRETQELFKEMREEMGDTFTDWGAGEGWLRLLPDNYTIALDCTTDGELSSVRFTSPDADETSTYGRATSLTALMTMWVSDLDSGAYTWVPETARWAVDDSKMHPLQFANGLR